MAWAYLNFAAMIVGYVTIAVVLLVILIFIGLVLREKYNDLKWKKRKEPEKQAAPVVAETKPADYKEAAKEEEKSNVQIPIK